MTGQSEKHFIANIIWSFCGGGVQAECGCGKRSSLEYVGEVNDGNWPWTGKLVDNAIEDAIADLGPHLLEGLRKEFMNGKGA